MQKVKIKNALQKMQSVWQGRRDSGEALRSESGAVSNPAETVACSVQKVKIKNALQKMQSVWQGRRDSNTQPAVLETAALPIEPLP